MSEETVTVLIRTADKTKKAEVTLPRSMTANDLIAASKQNWVLPEEADYQLVNVTKGRLLPPKQFLEAEHVSDGDELEVQPFHQHGC